MIANKLRVTKRIKIKFNVESASGWQKAVNKAADMQKQCCLYLFGNGSHYALTGFF